MSDIQAIIAAAAEKKVAGAAQEEEEAQQLLRDPRIQAGLEDAEFWYERYAETQTSPWDEDEPLELFLRAWFVQPPAKRIELLKRGRGHLYNELSTLFWRTHLLERDDARMMALVDKITREPGGEALDGVWRTSRLFELGAVRCLEYLADDTQSPDSELGQTIKAFYALPARGEWAKVDGCRNVMNKWFELAEAKGHTKVLEWGAARKLYTAPPPASEKAV